MCCGERLQRDWSTVTQRAAMAKAKKSLQTVVDAAVKAHARSRAVSIFPALKGEHAAAAITLVKNGGFTTVSEPLEYGEAVCPGDSAGGRGTTHGRVALP